ncbi:RNA pseudouridine synthase [Vibrio vulnificus]|uniref:RluA family pseudouridine synthase n=1 Tax=Vibrio vulnificus TaxID=672 RepID=UPI0015F7BBBB|nr:RluA family pseudouridine synthase [Vibrio vulnificus]MCA0765079.1 RNA pseudouridine synthase [Vibrio vulnificus]MDT9655855.1 pseudouridine synthase [Vibrio vulnificus]QMV39422.1 RNA pseudouridine synthase [Vibrio vulnificus]HAT8541936.1 RNA pseudouridine synthase [Vibrio vulnificus]HDY7614214.1 RNA pseudouridine synthase [Vibrio vulnificus]
MHTPDPCFTPFTTVIDGYALPERFTFPFYYTPHPLCVLAAEQLQQHLLTQQEWQHNFGLLNGEVVSDDESAIGKMFGVLLVENAQGDIGFLSAFSGKIADQNLLPGFVPPVFDMLAGESFFRRELSEITDINHQVKQLSQSAELAQLRQQIEADRQAYQAQEQAQRQAMIEGRAARKQQREQAEATLTGDALKAVLDDLAKQSVAEKNVLKYLKLEWDEKLASEEARLQVLLTQLDTLKEQRKTLSNALQHKLFAQYRFLNVRGEQSDLNAIFAPTTSPVPPAGSGECAAPKLLQYAFIHGLKPLAMAEFWWGVSPKSEVRQHKKFYPSCHSKCHPILGHMLQGLNMDPNPLEENWAEDKELEIVYQDEAMVVVNKPSGLLSVPGKTITDSAYTRLQALFPDVEGPFVIHRLDMATSGLLVFALTRRANKSLQKQFISRGVQKRYVALLEGEVSQSQGEITLPMRGDPDDRPRQLVCFEHGKPAHTDWQLIEARDGRSKLYLYPRTGRTHQLRVHCAHHLGLNMPMVGDGLYGEKANRLHLHAESLELDHPYSKERMHFQVDAEF